MSSAVALYIYYRVPRERLSEAWEAISQMQAALCTDWPGLSARLLRRTDADADAGMGSHQTWMEIYEHPAGVSADCQHALQNLVNALPDGLGVDRHCEVFVPLTTPAA